MKLLSQLLSGSRARRIAARILRGKGVPGMTPEDPESARFVGPGPTSCVYYDERDPEVVRVCRAVEDWDVRRTRARAVSVPSG